MKQSEMIRQDVVDAVHSILTPTLRIDTRDLNLNPYTFARVFWSGRVFW